MNTQKNILENLNNLSKFEPMTPRKIYYINRDTTYDTMNELIKIAKQTKQFVIQTKCHYKYKYPALIQILFAYKLKLFIILVDTEFHPYYDWYLHTKIQYLFSIILSSSNDIQSWNDIKTELKNFLDYAFFQFHQIEKIHVINIKHQFHDWMQKNFANIQQNYVALDDWTLEMAMGFTFQQFLDTTLSKSCNWNIGLFLQFDPDYVEEVFHRDTFVCNLQKGNRYRSMHSEYAVRECMAVNKIATLLRNNWTRKHAEN